MDPEAVAAAALRSPSVSGLFPGDAVEVATYLPGKRVPGVRVREGEVEVHVVARWATALPRVAEEVRRSVAPVVGGLPVSVYVDDVETPRGPNERRRGGSAKSA
ncbi:MAG: hypothetical protein ACRDJK_05220 [Actinomycetota bacterium]